VAKVYRIVNHSLSHDHVVEFKSLSLQRNCHIRKCYESWHTMTTPSAGVSCPLLRELNLKVFFLFLLPNILKCITIQYSLYHKWISWECYVFTRKSISKRDILNVNSSFEEYFVAFEHVFVLGTHAKRHERSFTYNSRFEFLHNLGNYSHNYLRYLLNCFPPQKPSSGSLKSF